MDENVKIALKSSFEWFLFSIPLSLVSAFFSFFICGCSLGILIGFIFPNLIIIPTIFISVYLLVTSNKLWASSLTGIGTGTAISTAFALTGELNSFEPIIFIPIAFIYLVAMAIYIYRFSRKLEVNPEYAIHDSFHATSNPKQFGLVGKIIVGCIILFYLAVASKMNGE